MTFHSLYRLERRGLLELPDPGSGGRRLDGRAAARARQECIADTGETIDDEIFDRFAARLSYMSGDFADDATYEQVAERSAAPAARSSISRFRRRSSGWSSRDWRGWA